MSNLSCTIKNKTETQQFFNETVPNSVRFAVANACTKVVFLGLERSERQIRDDFILRGGYVVGKSPGKGAIKYQKAIPHHDLSQISASWGSVDKMGSRDYSFMEDQEEGFANEKKPVPNPATIRRGGTKTGKVSKAYYLKNAQIKKLSELPGSGKNDKMTRVFKLSRAYRQGFGLPGSNQFFSFSDGEYAPGWSGGLFQFGQTAPPRDDLFYPNVKRLYYNPSGKSGEKRRRARKWMEKSQNTITQADLERLYFQEFDNQLARNMKNMF